MHSEIFTAPEQPPLDWDESEILRHLVLGHVFVVDEFGENPPVAMVLAGSKWGARLITIVDSKLTKSLMAKHLLTEVGYHVPEMGSAVLKRHVYAMSAAAHEALEAFTWQKHA